MKHRRIITEETPLGDYRATFDGFEPGDAMGTGQTEYDAILDLIAEAEECEQ